MPDRLIRLLPIFGAWPALGRKQMLADLRAGLTGAIIVLPQGVAYALIAGLPAQYGLYTAIIPPVIAGLFGSSHHLVSGPTAAISIVVFSVVSVIVPPEHPAFLSYVLTLTFMAGVIQVMLGIARVGTLVNFIPPTVVVGFTAGAAVVIAVSQLHHFLGLRLEAGYGLFDRLQAISGALPATEPHAVLIGGVTLATALVVRAFRPHWPVLLSAMAVGTGVGALSGGAAEGVQMVGATPGALPPPSFDLIAFERMSELASGALAVAMIALIEAVAIAKAVGMRSHQRIDGSQEFIGQGLSNLIGSLFSCYAASGSFTRTGANYDAGARTPIAGVIAAALVLAVIVWFPGVTGYLPMPTMAAVVFVIAWNLIDWHRLWDIVRASREETAILVVTVLATLFLGLEFAIYVGVFLSLLLFLKHSARPRLVSVVPMTDRPGRPLRNAHKRGLAECPQVLILRVDGPLFFGSLDHVREGLWAACGRGFDHVIIDGSAVERVDMAASEMLAQESERMRRRGGGLWLCGFKDDALMLLRHPVLRNRIGEQHLFSRAGDAIAAVFEQTPLCDACQREAGTVCRLLR